MAHSTLLLVCHLCEFFCVCSLSSLFVFFFSFLQERLFEIKIAVRHAEGRRCQSKTKSWRLGLDLRHVIDFLLTLGTSSRNTWHKSQYLLSPVILHRVVAAQLVRTQIDILPHSTCYDIVSMFSLEMIIFARTLGNDYFTLSFSPCSCYLAFLVLICGGGGGGGGGRDENTSTFNYKPKIECAPVLKIYTSAALKKKFH